MGESDATRPVETPARTVISDADAISPRVQREHIPFTFQGNKLDKSVGNWKAWSCEMLCDLNMCCLGIHVMEPQVKSMEELHKAPDPVEFPYSYQNWHLNDRMVRAYIVRNCADAEVELIADIKLAKGCWDALKTFHRRTQVDLILSALAYRIPRDKDMGKRVREVCDLMKQAFEMNGGITEELLSEIVILNALSTGHEHTRATILHDMQAADENTPYPIERLFAQLDLDLQMLLIEEQRASDESAIARAAKAKTSSSRNPRSKPSLTRCTNCRRINHTIEYCIRGPKGGMKGKTLDEARAAIKASKEPKNGASSSAKVLYTVKSASGKALALMHIDQATADALYAARATGMTPVQLFTGMPSIDLDEFPELAPPSPTWSNPGNVEEKNWLSYEEELYASIRGKVDPKNWV